MRIITGLYKGRILNMPKGREVRPTTEKVKESIFSSIMGYPEESIICDLFSGTGNLGLEALSRGAKLCYFSDISKESINIIKENISLCKADDKSKVLLGDYMKNLSYLKDKKEKIDIFFIDPPYNDGLYDNCLRLIKEYDLLNEDGLIILEHDKRDDFPDEIYGFKKWKEKNFGSISFSIFY